ncbi:MAG TPA: TlpA disulfide reductase family protein [Fibrobacteria bacterium]|jgi:thiol-disulfide isomerase/thioredoxin|nr:TlpA disulfide reductase family protein [Fibrobacteria bacterium]
MSFFASSRKKIGAAGAVTGWVGLALSVGLLVAAGAGWAAKTSQRPSIGKAAPAFSLQGLAGEESVKLSALRGKIVLVDFWASWCMPCRQLMPRIAALKAAYPDIEVVAVSVDANRDKAITFQRSVEPSLRAAHDGDHKVADAYGVERMPSCFLVDREGRLRFRHDGYGADDFDAIERQIRLLLEE